MYTSTVNNLYGGTTPNTVDLSTTVVEGTNITKTSNTVTVTGDNKKYLILSGHYSEGRSGRTQRWLAIRIRRNTSERCYDRYILP